MIISLEAKAAGERQVGNSCLSAASILLLCREAKYPLLDPSGAMVDACIGPRQPCASEGPEEYNAWVKLYSYYVTFLTYLDNGSERRFGLDST